MIFLPYHHFEINLAADTLAPPERMALPPAREEVGAADGLSVA
jgi:hypothetical protein